MEQDIIDLSILQQIPKLQHFKNIQSLKIKRLSSLSNQVYSIENENNQKIIYRVFNKDFNILIDRDFENKFAKYNKFPIIYYFNNNIRIEQYLDFGNIIDNLSLQKNILQYLPQPIAKFHNIDQNKFTDNTRNTCYNKAQNIENLQNIINLVQQSNVKQKDQIILLLENLKSVEFQKQLKDLEKYLQNKDSIQFCHNDLNYSNFLYYEQNQKIQIQLIDYEYCGLNYRGIEFGNLFNEIASKYEKKFEIDEKLIPSQNERYQFFLEYLYHLKQSTMDIKDFQKENENQIQNLEIESLVGRIFSCYFWCLIAALSFNLDIDFDIYQYIEFKHNLIIKLIQDLKNTNKI